MGDTIFIIEAPGKREKLEAILSEMGQNARVFATKGHLFELPPILSAPAIDVRFREIARAPRDKDRLDQLLAAAREAKQVVIATDADSEGDVIAWDVAEAIASFCPRPLRMRLRGLDAASVSSALASATEVRKDDAIPGRTRAIIDRLIGQTFSQNGIAVGRVSTALLGVVAGHRPSPYKLVLAAPDKDGGRPWRAETHVRSPLTLDVCRKIADLDLPPLSFQQRTGRSRLAANLGDILVRSSDQLGLSPREADRSMQKLYETGVMSYPRAGARGVSNFVSQYLDEMAKSQGLTTSSDGLCTKREEDVHDAPFPLHPVDAKRDPSKLGTDDAVATLVTRGLFAAMSDTEKELGIGGILTPFLIEAGFSKEIADFIASLEWSRETGPRYPGQNSWASSEVVRRRPDAALLEAAVDMGLGRPSTWANHIETFMSRGLVDDDLHPTEKGRAWINSSPRELLNPATSIAIERVCDSARPVTVDATREPWELLAAEIVHALPEALKKPILDLVACTPQHMPVASEAARRVESTAHRFESLRRKS